MNWSSVRGIVLVVLLLSFVFTFFSIDSFAQKAHTQNDVINANSIAFEETTIIEFENTEKSSKIEMVRLWLGSDFTFKSFKTEKGWTGEKTPEGVLVFTTKVPLQPGESVKFGVKTNKPKPGINWKVLDVSDVVVGIGKTNAGELPSLKPETPSSQGSIGILEESTFRLIPEKPKVGSSVRIAGEKFVPNESLDFFIDSVKLESFKTDERGNFVLSTKVPDTQQANRVNFIVKDSLGNERTVSLRLGEAEEKPVNLDRPLTIQGLPPTMYRGDEIKVSGTATPGSSVTATVRGPDNNIVNTIPVKVDASGNWNYESMVPIDAPFGKYSAEITDGKETILRSWNVETSQTILLNPTKSKFDPGETIKFNGTAIPNEDLEVVIENPQGFEVFSDIFTVDSSGFVEFGLETTFNFVEGTYVVFATQGTHSEIILAGLGQIPEEQLVIKSDRLNYKAGETVTFSLIGPQGISTTFLVIDPSEQEKFSDFVELGPEGSKEFQLELNDFASGAYTAVVKYGQAQANTVFTVGLQTGSGPIELGTTKDVYVPGEQILVLGKSAKNVLITLTLLDPEGKEIKQKETFTTKEGTLSNDSFRVPSNANPGIWTIHAKSGANFKTIDIEVVPSLKEGMFVSVIDIKFEPTIGKVVQIKVTGASQTVTIEIYDPDQNLVETLEFPASGEGEVNTPWPVPKGSPNGIYTIKASDAVNEAQTTFELN